MILLPVHGPYQPFKIVNDLIMPFAFNTFKNLAVKIVIGLIDMVGDFLSFGRQRQEVKPSIGRIGNPFHQANIYQAVDGSAQSAFVQAEPFCKHHGRCLTQIFDFQNRVTLRQGDPLAATVLFDLICCQPFKQPQLFSERSYPLFIHFSVHMVSINNSCILQP